MRNSQPGVGLPFLSSAAAAVLAVMAAPEFVTAQAARVRYPYPSTIPPPRFRELTSLGSFAGTFPSNIAVLGDVDGDGDLDVVFAVTRDQDRLFLNDGHGRFTDVSATHVPFNAAVTSDLALGDVDGDGDLDMLVGDNGLWSVVPPNTRILRLLENDGSGRFTDVSPQQLPSARTAITSAQAVEFTDMDGDGSLDILIGNISFANNQVMMFLNDGTGTFRDVTATHVPVVSGTVWNLSVGDLDGDGDIDIVTGGIVWSTRVWMNTGNGVLREDTAARLLPAPGLSEHLDLGDVDGDGDLDLVVMPSFGKVAPACPYLYRNDGRGVFNGESMGIMRELTSQVTLADLDGDADLDVVFANSSARTWQFPIDPYGQDTVFENDGQGHFTDATKRFLPISFGDTTGVVAGDLDGDGDQDLVISRGAGKIGFGGRLLFNVQRQVYAVEPPSVGTPHRVGVFGLPGDVAQLYAAGAEKRTPLPPLGTLGLDPASLIALPGVLTMPVASLQTVTLPIPSDPSLAGLPLVLQALVVEPNPPVSARLTNVLNEVVR